MPTPNIPAGPEKELPQITEVKFPEGCEDEEAQIAFLNETVQSLTGGDSKDLNYYVLNDETILTSVYTAYHALVGVDEVIFILDGSQIQDPAVELRKPDIPAEAILAIIRIEPPRKTSDEIRKEIKVAIERNNGALEIPDDDYY